MISKEEIVRIADETSLTPHVVEKDYVLGWVLAGINSNSVLSDTWVFKGGTCLKKCYFETYRFSEDLDFTLRDASHLEEQFLIEQFKTISEWLYENCGLQIPADRLRFDIYNNPRGNPSCEGRLYYQSYFAVGKHAMPKIKLDLTADEVLVMPPSDQRVFHNYTDNPEGGIQIKCYSHEEVFAEKIRALGERGRPRDVYDVINLYRNDYLPAPAVVKDILSQKCAFKGIELPSIDDMEEYKEALARNWEPMLGHQLPSLPPMEAYVDTLPEFFEWLHETQNVHRPNLGAVPATGEAYRPDYGHLGLRTRSGEPLEIIRFAASNRLCVDLDYTSNNGERKTRRIEPYSLRRAQNGNVLLYAVRSEDGQIRAYKVDQINAVSVSNQVFTPRYQIELSPSGQISAPALTRTSYSSLGIPRQRTRSARTSHSSGPTYIFRCPMCDKTFRRKSYNAKLNAHKDKDGWPCSGRTGYYEDTVY